MIRIRPFQSGDASKITGFREIFPPHTPAGDEGNYWLWANRIWPIESSIVMVAEEDGELVAHYAILPFRLVVNDRVVQGGMSIDAYVDPKARGKVPIFQVTKRCYPLAIERGIQVLWGFPNANYRLIVEKVEGWSPVDVFRSMEKQSTQVQGIPLELDQLSPSDPGDAFRLSEFLDSCRLPALIHVGQSYSAWFDRYVRHPLNEYEFHFVSQASRPVAAVVTKVYRDPETGTSIGHLVDLATADVESYESVVATIEKYFQATVDRLSIWPTNQHLRSVLEAAGYTPTGFETYFGIKIIDPSLNDLASMLQSIDRWHLPMGMSDVI